MIRRNNYTPHKGRAVTLTAYRPWKYGLPSFFPMPSFVHRRRKGMGGDVRLRYMLRSRRMGTDYVLLRANVFCGGDK